MRTTIQIDEAVYAQAEVQAAKSGRSVSRFIEDAVRDALLPRERPARPLPVFGGSGVLPGVILSSSNAALFDVMDEGGQA